MSDIFSVLFKNGMLAAYAGNSQTPLFLVMPGPLSRFYLRGCMLFHDSKTQSPQEIYQAETPEQAAMLLKAIQEDRQHRDKQQNKMAVIFLGVILMLVLAGLGKYRSDERRILPPIPPLSLSEPARNVPDAVDLEAVPRTALTLQNPAPVTQAIPDSPADTRAVRAASLKKAADSGRYTIALSSGHARTIYVFSDPLCPHCREIEPTLEALTRDYNVVIFPVTLVGKQDTVAAVSPLLCSAPLIRAPLWENIFRPGIGPSPATPDTKGPGPLRCADGDHAISVNDRAFDYYQLPGTPQLIADDGRDIPFSALTSDDALASFMNAPIQGVNDANR
ncbi:hypothetical protein CIT83_22270 [Salmonella enterica]|nr:hypothetical protein [Salmonella enterica]MIV18888.1 hypothetical protein [Salmonella enterica]